MSQISKCPKLRVVLGYWEALGEVSELRYKNLLYSSSKRSYCSFMVTHVVSWFGLAIDLVFFFIVFSFLLLWIFFVDKDDDKVVQVVWFNYCFCCCSQLFSSLCC